MDSEKMFDASLYNITVRKGNFDGEVFFEAKVKELPDVAEYAETYEEAYLLALDTIETTAEALAEEGKVMPAPILENDDFSGRVTLRMPKSMHAALSSWSESEDISLNQLLVNCLAFNLGEQFGVSRTIHSIKSSIGAIKQTEFMHVQPKRQQTSKVVPIKPIPLIDDAMEQRCYG
ncbi:toxin-antitoxin system HicB family antitoxin [Pseudoalteromonas sp. MEBiC 03485]|uniref:toxin-antitoxin system HicB family antitoxin n=1 Tax=Pseudoalteromonas sp. MEBiC 03485 TaxID=2571103 RepID=UPI00198079DA|nr:toxin-antitoxin system HicB family antitoxin [Pseudoalteromonas sp. MEBiC 03485]